MYLLRCKYFPYARFVICPLRCDIFYIDMSVEVYVTSLEVYKSPILICSLRCVIHPFRCKYLPDMYIPWGVGISYRRTWIVLGGKTSVCTGTRGSQWSVGGPKEILKRRSRLCRCYLSSLVFVDLMESANCEIELQIVVIQETQNTIITGHSVYVDTSVEVYDTFLEVTISPIYILVVFLYWILCVLDMSLEVSIFPVSFIAVLVWWLLVKQKWCFWVSVSALSTDMSIWC